MVRPSIRKSPAEALIVSRTSPDVALVFDHRRQTTESEVALKLLTGYGHEAVATLASGASAPSGSMCLADQVAGRTAVHRALERVTE